MKRILYISRNFPPLVGGMERLNYEVCQQLSNVFHVDIIVPFQLDTLPNIYPCNTHSPLAFLWKAYQQLKRLMSQHTYDVVIGGSGLIAPLLSYAQTKHSTKTLLFVHGLDITAPNWLYQRYFVTLFTKQTRLIANSENTKQLLLEKRISAQSISIIHPGLNPSKPSISEQLDEFIRSYSLQHKKVILFVGRVIKRKGLSHFIEKCLPSIVQQDPTAHLVIVGDKANHSLSHKDQEIKRCITLAKQLNLLPHITWLGKVDDTHLSYAYQTATVSIFPLTPVKGDVEGFGMVAAESASYGTPCIAFACGGVTDAIQQGVSGELISPLDYQAFTDTVLTYLNNSKFERDACISFANKFSWDNYHAQLNSILESL